MMTNANAFFSPLRYAVEILYHKDAPYSKAARSVGVAIAARLNSTPKQGIYKASMGRKDIQERSGYGEDRVDAAIKELCGGSHPVFQKIPGRMLKDMRREPNTYVLIVHQDNQRPAARVAPMPPSSMRIQALTDSDEYDENMPF
jgi:hypothetical protein